MKKLFVLSIVLLAFVFLFMGCPPVDKGNDGPTPTPSGPCSDDNSVLPSGDSMLYTITSDTTGTDNQVQDFLWFIVPNGKTAVSVSMYIKIDHSKVGGTNGFKGVNTGIIHSGWDAGSTDFPVDDQWHLYSRTIGTPYTSTGYGAGVQIYNDATPTGPASVSDVQIYVDNFVVNYSDCSFEKFDFDADGSAITQFGKASDSGSAVSTLTWTGGAIPTPSPTPVFCGDENLTAPDGGSLLFTITSDTPGAGGTTNIQEYLWFTLNPSVSGKTVSSISFYLKIDSSYVGLTAGFKGINVGLIHWAWQTTWSALPTDNQWTKFSIDLTSPPTYDGAGVGFQLQNDNIPDGPATINNIPVYIDNFVVNYTDCTSVKYDFTTDDGTVALFSKDSESTTAVSSITYAP